MSIELFDPVGELPAEDIVRAQHLTPARGLRIGYVFNHHPAAEAVWAGMVAHIRATLHPGLEATIDKVNVSLPAPEDALQTLAAQVDAIIVGVGA